MEKRKREIKGGEGKKIYIRIYIYIYVHIFSPAGLFNRVKRSLVWRSVRAF